MFNSEKVLKAWLRLAGFVQILAIIAVFMPRPWMDLCAAQMELAALPRAPIFEYLARSLSAFYAMVGGLYWLASTDVRRYAGLIIYFAVAGFLFAPAIFLIDYTIGMPHQWTFSEGPIVLAISLMTLALQRRAALSR